MIGSYEIQLAYNDLYVQLRKYIWDFSVVCLIADLEIASYQALPDIPSVRSCLNKLKSATYEIQRNDEDLKKAFQDFEDALTSDEVYTKLYKVSEVVPA